MQLTNVTGMKSADVAASAAVGASVPQKDAVALFEQAKAAIGAKDFGAFKALQHPWVEEFATPAQQAELFAELTAQDVSGWTLGPVQDGADGPFALIQNAPDGTLMAMQYNGADLKVLLLGTLRF